MSKKIHGLNTDDDKPPRHGSHSGSESGEDSDEGRQGFFVGGSDRSGQEVLGPNRNDRSDRAARLFEALQRAGAEKLTQEQADALNAKQQRQGQGTSATAAGAFRLGGHGVQSERMGQPATATGSATAGGRQQPIVVRLVFWSNGFTVNDGPLRQFDDPQNKEFLQAIMTKRIPPELNVPGREIDLRIERKTTEYEAPKVKPFSGKGQQLGSVTPNVIDVDGGDAGIEVEPISPEEAEKLREQAQLELKVDDDQPTTRIQIRIPGADRPIVARLNHTHTVYQLRMFIVATVPSLSYRPFRLWTVYPNKVIEDEEKSVKDAELTGATVLVKYDA